MSDYPINLNIKNKKCLVVGGGTVGLRKARNLLKAGARVELVSPKISKEILQLQNNPRFSLKQRSYQPEDMKGAFLAFAATNQADLNEEIRLDAKREKALCNVADNPQKCDFTLPATLSQGDLLICISTSGKSPALARILRKELEAQFGPEYAECLKIMGDIRRKLLKRGRAPDAHRDLFRAVLKGGLVERLRAGDTNGVKKLVFQVFGEDILD